MTGSEIIIRRAETAEWDSAMEVVWRTFLKFEAPLYGEEGKEHFYEFISGEQLHKMFEIGEYPMWVALDDNRIVGVASLRTGNHISLLFVDEAYHRRGIGKRLVAAMQRHAMQRGSVKLTVNSSPYGEPFYHALGFMDSSKTLRTDGIIYTPMILLEELQQ